MTNLRLWAFIQKLQAHNKSPQEKLSWQEEWSLDKSADTTFISMFVGKIKRLKTCVGEMEKASEANLHTSQRIISLTRSKMRRKWLKRRKVCTFSWWIASQQWGSERFTPVFVERRFPSRTNGFWLLPLSQKLLSVLSTQQVTLASRNQISAAAFHHLPAHFLLHSPNPSVREIYGAASNPWDRLILVELAGFIWNKWPGLLIVVPLK